MVSLFFRGFPFTAKHWVKLKKRSDSFANKPNYSLFDSSDALNYVN